MTTSETRNSDGEKEAKRTRDISLLLIRNLAVQLIGVARQFVILPLISPAQLGLFRFVTTTVSYSSHLVMGAIAAFQIRFPEWDAAGKDEECRQLQSLAWRQVLIAYLVFIPVCWLFLRDKLEPWLAVTVALLGATPLVIDYISSSFNVRTRFRELATIDVLSAVANFVCLVLGAYYFGVSGIILASFVGAAVYIGMGRQFLSPPKGAIESRDFARDIRKFGMRVWASSSLMGIGHTIDILLIGLLLGTDSPELGLYVLALSLVKLIYADVRAVAVVQVQEIRRAFGEGRAHDDLGQLIVKAIVVEALVAVVLSAAVLSVAVLVLPYFAPAYAPSAIYLAPIAAATAISKSYRYSSLALLQLDRSAVHAVAGGLLVVLTSALVVSVVSLGETLLLVAIGRIAVSTIVALVDLNNAFRCLGQRRLLRRLYWRYVLALLPFVLSCTAGGLGYRIQSIAALSDSPSALVATVTAGALLSVIVTKLLFPGPTKEALSVLIDLLALPRRIIARASR